MTKELAAARAELARLRQEHKDNEALLRKARKRAEQVGWRQREGDTFMIIEGQGFGAFSSWVVHAGCVPVRMLLWH